MGLIVFHSEFNMQIKTRYYQTYSQSFQLFHLITLVNGYPMGIILKVICKAKTLLWGVGSVFFFKPIQLI